MMYFIFYLIILFYIEISLMGTHWNDFTEARHSSSTHKVYFYAKLITIDVFQIEINLMAYAARPKTACIAGQPDFGLI